MPQPAVLEGQPGAPPNPDHDNATKRYHSWTQDGVSFVTVWTQTYRWLDEDTLEWRVENSTRRTDATAPPVVSNHTWTQDWTGVVLQVDDFESGDTVWALFDGNLREPMRPTPSQLTGRTLPTPDGFLVYQIEPDGYTMGCSSKFVPEDRRDEFDKDGDGYTD